MLVLSRRENEQIDFPALGISVTVLSSSRSRASLGISAPDGVRIVRHEITDEVDLLQDDGRLVNVAKQQIAKHLAALLDDKMRATTKRLESAQQQLSGGKSEAAMRELTAALADLDAIRASLNSNQFVGDPEENRYDVSQNWASTDERSAAKSQSVSESGSTYSVCVDHEKDDAPDQQPTVSGSWKVDWSIGSDPWLATA